MVVTGQMLQSFGTRRLFKILGNEINNTLGEKRSGGIDRAVSSAVCVQLLGL